MATLSSTQAGSSPDYYKYATDTVTKTDQIGDPNTLDFTLVKVDDQFVRLNRGAYITASSSVLKDINGNSVDWFTGYITNDPEYVYVGLDKTTKQPVFSLKYQAQSDECILSQQSLGICNPFINMTQGQILAALAEQLLPGMFDTSGIQDGLLLARYVVDPTQNYQDIVKSFCTSAVYRFWGRSKKLFFTPQDAAAFPSSVSPTTVDGNDIHFTPDNLTIRATQQGIINDAVVLGATEPQEFITEYFVGDGSTADFALMNSVFGIESALLLDDDFSNGQISTTNWTVYDQPSNFLQVSNGYLNVLGGSQNGTFDVHLDSANLIPIEGNLRITHGDFEFLDAGQPDGLLGVVGGLWTQTPSPSLTGCLYGILVKKAAGITTLSEIVNGVASTTNVLPVNFQKSYVLRTTLSASRIDRAYQSYNYFDNEGTIHTVSVPPDAYPDTVSFTTHISEIDLVTGVLSNGFPVLWNSSETFASNEKTFATYVLVASQNLHATATDTTISTPFQASLAISPSVISAAKESTVTITGAVDSTSLTITGTVTFSSGGVVLGTAPVLNGNATLIVAASAIASSGVSGTFTPSGTTNPGTVTVVTSPASTSTFESGVAPYAQQIVGPNEVDGLDGQAPVATVTQSGGITQKSTTLGTPKYQASSPELLFFKNSSTYTSTIPKIGDLIRLKYRQAGAAVAKVRDAASVATEAQNWGDSGIRSVTRNDLSPQPTNSAECEAAAAAIIYEAARPRFEGTYTFYSDYSTTEPLAGMVLPFKNLPSSAFEVQNFAEMIYEVQTNLLSISPIETYTHEVSFGKATDQLRVQQILSKIGTQPDVFAPQDSAEVPNYVDPDSIGTAWASELLFLEISSMSADTITLTAPSPIPAGLGIEVRSADSGWGCDSSNNLIGRFGTQTFAVPRNSRNKAIFAKFYDTRNQWIWSEDLTKMPAAATGYPLVQSQGASPDGGLSAYTVFTPNGTHSFVDITSTKVAASTSGCFSISVKGAAGQTFSISAYANGSGTPLQTATFTCTGAWLRGSIPFSFASGVTGDIYYRIAASGPVSICHASVEFGVSKETVFCKTAGSPYGALSRYASGVRVNLPLVPPPPTVSLTLASPVNPVITLTLPQIAVDVWGFEIRAEDNVTVLEHQDLSDSGVNPSIAMPQINSRNVEYYCYTYNLLGEYSQPCIVALEQPMPTLNEVDINNLTKMLEWVSSNCTGFLLEIDNVDNTFTHKVVNQQVTSNYFQLSDADFFEERYFRLTPYDEFGDGNPSVSSHSYLPEPLTALGSNEVGVIVEPANGQSAIVVPSNFQQYGGEYSTIAYAMYKQNTTG